MVLDPRIRALLKAKYNELNDAGRLIPRNKLEIYYQTFRQRFGPERLRSLDGEALLEVMHNSSNKDSLVYWLEFKNDEEFPTPEFGSIAGGSALKFGLYKQRETGNWMTGASKKQKELSLEAAVEIARRNRDQLCRGIEILSELPPNAGDEDYRKIQELLAREAPDVQDTVWGHKYFSLFFPEKLDNIHNPEYQRYHLVKLLQIPPKGEGRYLVAGRFVAIAAELGLPMNHFITVLFELNGSPHTYWRIGTSESGPKSRSEWERMRDGNLIAVRYAEIGDLSGYEPTMESREKIKSMVRELIYPNNPKAAGAAGYQGTQLFDFLAAKTGDIVVACHGKTVLGIGRIIGPYRYESGAVFSHIRPVEWLSLEEWELDEGLQTTFVKIDEPANQVKIETILLEATQPNKLSAAPYIPSKTFGLSGLPGRIWAVLERKGQVILYGPPGTGKTYWAEKTARAIAGQGRQEEGNRLENARIQFTCFHPSYGYEDFIEGYRPQVNANGSLSYELRDGVFKKLCRQAAEDPTGNYVLIIDEINRGDIPRIFGELLTVMEKNKRGTKILLPLSGQSFHVPPNLYIIGTMNTADRSIALLDMALRRRFGFIELMPDYDLLAGVMLEGIPLGPWLKALNQKICEFIGKDGRNLQVGHAYFLEDGRPIRDFARFARVIQEDIIPLVQEYCYEDPALLEKFFGVNLANAIRRGEQERFFDPAQPNRLVQALLEPYPELSSSVAAVRDEAVNLESEPEDKIEDGDT